MPRSSNAARLRDTLSRRAPFGCPGGAARSALDYKRERPCTNQTD
jgi:hypothetical protein